MSIRTIESAEASPGVTVSRVEVTYTMATDRQRTIVWELYCEHCDEVCNGLTEDEAFEEAEKHGEGTCSTTT